MLGRILSRGILSGGFGPEAFCPDTDLGMKQKSVK